MIGSQKFPLKDNVGKALSAITEREKKKPWGSVRSLNAISEREDQRKYEFQRSQSEDFNLDSVDHESEKPALRFTVLVSAGAHQHDDEVSCGSEGPVYHEFQLEEVIRVYLPKVH